LFLEDKSFIPTPLLSSLRHTTSKTKQNKTDTKDYLFECDQTRTRSLQPKTPSLTFILSSNQVINELLADQGFQVSPEWSVPLLYPLTTSHTDVNVVYGEEARWSRLSNKQKRQVFVGHDTVARVFLSCPQFLADLQEQGTELPKCWFPSSCSTSFFH
jgi:hypothetical protein